MSSHRPFVFKKAQPLSDHDVIPVLDLGPFLAGEPGALARLGREVCRALEDISLISITGGTA